MTTIVILIVILLALMTNLYISMMSSVITVTLWKALLFGFSYMESDNEDGSYAVFEIHIACIVITLIYDI